MSSTSPVRVFISYSHDSLEHRTRIWNFAKKLRNDGVDAIIDQYFPFPEEGFPKWMEEQIEVADFVILVCTSIYFARVRGKDEPGIGHGVLWESNLIYQWLYDEGTRNRKFLPVLFTGGKPSFIPRPLRGFAYYYVETVKGYEALYRRITSQPSWLAPPIGKLKTLPPDDPADSRDERAAEISNILRKLLKARTIQELDRCLVAVEEIIDAGGNTADARLLKKQIEQAIEWQKTVGDVLAVTDRRRRLRLQLLTWMPVAIITLVLVIVGPRRAWQAAGQLVHGIVERFSHKPKTPAYVVAPDLQLPIDESLTITSLANDSVVPSASEVVVKGRVIAQPPIFVYFLHRPLGENAWRIDKAVLRAVGSWAVYSDMADLQEYRSDYPEVTVEVVAVESTVPLEVLLHDQLPYQSQFLPLHYSQELSKLQLRRSEGFRVRVVQSESR